jgi:hypothetical protein
MCRSCLYICTCRQREENFSHLHAHLSTLTISYNLELCLVSRRSNVEYISGQGFCLHSDLYSLFTGVKLIKMTQNNAHIYGMGGSELRGGAGVNISTPICFRAKEYNLQVNLKNKVFGSYLWETFKDQSLFCYIMSAQDWSSFYNIGLVHQLVYLFMYACTAGYREGRWKGEKAWGICFRFNDQTYHIPNVRFHLKEIGGKLKQIFWHNKKLVSFARIWLSIGLPNAFPCERDFRGATVTAPRMPGSLWPGVDVMITIFCDFWQFSAKKLAFFSKTDVVIKIFHNLALFWFKNANFFAEFFAENI